MDECACTRAGTAKVHGKLEECQPKPRIAIGVGDPRDGRGRDDARRGWATCLGLAARPSTEWPQKARQENAA